MNLICNSSSSCWSTSSSNSPLLLPYSMPSQSPSNSTIGSPNPPMAIAPICPAEQMAAGKGDGGGPVQNVETDGDDGEETTKSDGPLEFEDAAGKAAPEGRKQSSACSSNSSTSSSPSAPVRAGKRRWEKPEVCLICGQPAQCLNFGAHCCHACRMFFRRSVLNFKEFSCKFNANCDITKGKNCRSCRFDSCVLAQLDISLIQFPPNYDIPALQQRLAERRLELLEKNSRLTTTMVTNGIEKSLTSIIELMESNKCLDHLLAAEKRAKMLRESPNNLLLEYLCGKNVADLLTSQMNVLNFVELFTANGCPLRNDERQIMEAHCVPFIGSYLNVDMLLNIELMRTLPVFGELNLEDKVRLFQQNVHKLVTLCNGFYSFQLNADTVTFPNGFKPVNLCRDALERALGDEKLKRYINLRRRAFCDQMSEFKTINLSVEEFVLLRAIIFCNTVPEHCSTEAKCRLKSAAEGYGRCLLRHLQMNKGDIVGARKYAECLLFATKIFDYNRRQAKFQQIVDWLLSGIYNNGGAALPNPTHPPFVSECLLEEQFDEQQFSQSFIKSISSTSSSSSL